MPTSGASSLPLQRPDPALVRAPGRAAGPSVTALRVHPQAAAGSAGAAEPDPQHGPRAALKPQRQVDDRGAVRGRARRAIGPAQRGRERPASASAVGRRRAARRRGGPNAASTPAGVPGAARPPARQRALRAARPRREQPERRGDGVRRRGRRAGARPPAKPRDDGAEHGGDAPGGEREHPRRLGVRAGAEAVQQRDRPAGVGEPVHRAPRCGSRGGGGRGSSARRATSRSAARACPGRSTAGGSSWRTARTALTQPMRGNGSSERRERRGRRAARAPAARPCGAAPRPRSGARRSGCQRARPRAMPSTTAARQQHERDRAGRRGSRTTAPRARARRGDHAASLLAAGHPATVTRTVARDEPRRAAPRSPASAGAIAAARSPPCSRCWRPRRSRPRR